MSARAHDFMSSEPDMGRERISAGYVDECLDFTTFAGSLAALVTDGEWLIQPFTQKRLAIIVDFASKTQAEAEASLQHGWNGAWEFPIGCVNTVRSRVETNEQNAWIERHISLIATGDTMRDFFWDVTERLLDSHSCKNPECRVCKGRFQRDLALTLTIFADLGFSTLYLFSHWEPSQELRKVLRNEQIEIQWNPLTAIPPADLEANRFYTIWDGTEKQYADFITRFWAPSWQRGQQFPLSPVPKKPATPRAGVLKIRLPVARPEWRSIDTMHFVGFYMMQAPEFNECAHAAFVEEANRHCLSLLHKLRGMTTDPGDFTWLLVPADIAPSSAAHERAAGAWLTDVRAEFHQDDEAAQSLWEAWGPRLIAALRFALPIEPSPAQDVLDGDSGNVVMLTHDSTSVHG
jgi:hypothetical protein